MSENDINFKLLNDENLNEYLELLKNLSDTIETEKMTNLMNYYKIMELYPHIQIWIAKDTYSNEIIGCGTIIIEPKFIHNCKNVAHIEDVCIKPKYRNKGYGNKVIQLLIDISKLNDCYKIILNCNEKNKIFYEKCGFTETNKQMSIYLE